MPKTEQMKESFMEALSCAVGTIESNFFNGYVNKIDEVMKEVLEVLEVSVFVEGSLLNSERDKQEKKEHIPVNSSSDSCIMEENNINERMELNVIKGEVSNIGYIALNDLNILYKNIKINCEKSASAVGILFFILFSILVVRIKDTIAVIINNKIINRKEPAWLR
jgi:hypothetical protein